MREVFDMSLTITWRPAPAIGCGHVSKDFALELPAGLVWGLPA